MRKQNGRKNLYCLENGMTEKQNSLASLENYCIRRLRRHLPFQGKVKGAPWLLAASLAELHLCPHAKAPGRSRERSERVFGFRVYYEKQCKNKSTQLIVSLFYPKEVLR